MDDRFKHIGEADDKLIEECSELIKAIIKAKRFGWFSRWPRPDGEINMDAVFREIEDVRKASRELQTVMMKISMEERHRQEMIIGGPISTEPPQMSSSFAPPASAVSMTRDLARYKAAEECMRCMRCGEDSTNCSNCMKVVHYMSDKVMGAVGVRTRCNITVSPDNTAWVSDDWARVTCPECLKLRTFGIDYKAAEAG